MKSSFETTYPLTLTPNGSYTLQLNLGTPGIPINLAIDTMSDYFVVTSELCFYCHTKVYKPGYSLTTKNTGKMWKLDFEDYQL